MIIYLQLFDAVKLEGEGRRREIKLLRIKKIDPLLPTLIDMFFYTQIKMKL